MRTLERKVTAAGSAPDLSGRIALIVEDQAPIRAQLRRDLVAMNMEVHEAADGAALLAYIQNPQNKYPDIIFLDEGLGVLNGSEAIAMIMREQPTFAVPIFIVTGNADASFVQKIAELKTKGAPIASFLVKGVSLTTAELHKRVPLALKMGGRT